MRRPQQRGRVDGCLLNATQLIEKLQVNRNAQGRLSHEVLDVASGGQAIVSPLPFSP